VTTINKLDPRTKIVLVLMLSSISLMYDELLMLFIILLLTFASALLINVDFQSIIFKLKKILKLIIVIAIIQSLFTKEGTPILQIGMITIFTNYGIIKALQFLLRMSIIIVSSSIIITSSSREIIQGLVKWGCPYEIAFMVMAAIRFLPVFKEELTDITIALKLRGIDFNRIKINQKLKIYKYILLPIITNSILKARELSSAMEMRAFRAYPVRTSYMVLKMQKTDYLVLVICLFISAILFIIQWRLI